MARLSSGHDVGSRTHTLPVSVAEAELVERVNFGELLMRCIDEPQLYSTILNFSRLMIKELQYHGVVPISILKLTETHF